MTKRTKILKYPVIIEYKDNETLEETEFRNRLLKYLLFLKQRIDEQSEELVKNADDPRNWVEIPRE